MKKFLLTCLGILTMTGCTNVKPGYVGILVNNWGSQRGVQDFPIRTGLVTYNPIKEDVYRYPTYRLNKVWTKARTEGSPNDDSISFNSIEGALCNCDISISCHFLPEKVPSLFVAFRLDSDHIIDVYVRSEVRDAFSRHASRMKVIDIFGSGKQDLLESVMADLNTKLAPQGIKFEMVSMVGEIRVDEKVQASINAVIQANQAAIEAENKVRQAKAEAEQKIASAVGDSVSTMMQANAQSLANKKLAASLTPELIRWQALQKWDGGLPKVTGGSIPLVDLKQ